MDRSEPDQHKHTQPERNMNERQFINDRALLMPQALLLLLLMLFRYYLHLMSVCVYNRIVSAVTHTRRDQLHLALHLPLSRVLKKHTQVKVP